MFQSNTNVTTTPASKLLAHVRGEIPYLRRLARALVGERRFADLCVVQLMEALLSDPNLTSVFEDQKASLYRPLLKLLEAVPPLDDEDFGRIVRTPRALQANLLICVAGFSLSQTADLLDISDSNLDRLLLEANIMIGCQKKSRVLIIEDEIFISKQLELIVRSLGHQVVGVARTHAYAVDKARGTAPDLILSDVHLADGSSGIDAVAEITPHEDVPVVFITAYPENFLMGVCNEPTYLITKPFVQSAVTATISQAIFARDHRQ